MASQELDPLIDKMRPNMTTRIVEAVAIAGSSTRPNILRAVGSAQTDGGSGHQRINWLIADGVLAPAESTEPDGPQEYCIDDESAKLLIDFYKNRIAAMQAVISALESSVQH